ncbi:hypothetical protein [Kineococcus sp. SYSU DK001]|uniref:hypothetical protein n=1 Tax=Kineococcus sp. SYSU DK001 TaxID=3383122 RepID=UPI003D7CCF0B
MHVAVEANFEAIRRLNRRDRARVTGFGPDLQGMHMAGAERYRRIARAQYGVAVEAIRERRSRSDWLDFVQASRQEAERRGLEDLLGDVDDQIREVLLEQDSLSPVDAEEVLSIVRRVVGALREGWVDGVLNLLEERLSRAVTDVDDPEMGRQPASPVMTAQEICITVMIAETMISFAACWFIPFCWCCAALWILGTLAPKMATCVLLFPNG